MISKGNNSQSDSGHMKEVLYIVREKTTSPGSSGTKQFYLTISYIEQTTKLALVILIAN